MCLHSTSFTTWYIFIIHVCLHDFYFPIILIFVTPFNFSLSLSLLLFPVTTRALIFLCMYSRTRVHPPRKVQPPSRLHISTPGIGVDGERGYNSSHCIGSSRVIGLTPSLSIRLLFLLCLVVLLLSLSLSLTLLTSLNPFVSHPPIVSHFPKARRDRVLYCYAQISLSIAIATNCAASAVLCPFSRRLV